MRFIHWIQEALADLVFRITYPVPLGRADRREVRTTIKRLRALKKAGVLVYAATNRVKVKGTPLSLLVSAGGVLAGSVAQCGAGATALFGIVESAKDATNVAVMHFEGVWNVTITSVGAIAVGDPIYAIPGTAVLTQTAAGNKLFGNAVTALLGATTGVIQCRLAGSN